VVVGHHLQMSDNVRTRFGLGSEVYIVWSLESLPRVQPLPKPNNRSVCRRQHPPATQHLNNLCSRLGFGSTAPTVCSPSKASSVSDVVLHSNGDCSDQLLCADRCCVLHPLVLNAIQHKPVGLFPLPPRGGFGPNCCLKNIVHAPPALTESSSIHILLSTNERSRTLSGPRVASPRRASTKTQQSPSLPALTSARHSASRLPLLAPGFRLDSSPLCLLIYLLNGSFSAAAPLASYNFAFSSSTHFFA